MILYFSATGNCKYVVTRLAQLAEIVSIVDCIREKKSRFEDDVIGIVSPTYDWGLPSIVREFLVSKNAPERKLHFYIEGKKFRRLIFILEKQIVNFTDAGMLLRS